MHSAPGNQMGYVKNTMRLEISRNPKKKNNFKFYSRTHAQ